MKRERQQVLQAEFEQLSTEKLDEMLQAELQEEASDPDVVTAILAVLQEREKDMPLTLTEGEAAAWKKYLSRRESLSAKPAKRFAWALRAACIVVILGVCLVAVPSRADANGFWNRIVRWTDSVIELFSPGETGGMKQEYEFRTDHPGLQQVYDAVTRLGVKRPVVPMWLPEGYELVQRKEIGTRKKQSLMATFQNDEGILNYSMAVYLEDTVNRYQKDETEVRTIEIENVKFHITRNHDMWVAIWTIENIECFISVDCREEELYQILHSIYDKEETA